MPAAAARRMVTFTPEAPGRILAFKLQAGQSLICQKDAFMAAQESVSLEMHFRKQLGAGLFGGEGFVLQKISGPGLVFLEIAGDVREYTLQPGEMMRVDPGHIALYEPGVAYDIAVGGRLKSALFSGEGLFLATLTGPGKVWLQSMPISNLAAGYSPVHPDQEQLGAGADRERPSRAGGPFLSAPVVSDVAAYNVTPSACSSATTSGAMTSPGSMLATRMRFISSSSRPMARIMMPPTADISAIMVVVEHVLRHAGQQRQSALIDEHGQHRKEHADAQRRGKSQRRKAIQHGLDRQQRIVAVEAILNRPQHGQRADAEDQAGGDKPFGEERQAAVRDALGDAHLEPLAEPLQARGRSATTRPASSPRACCPSARGCCWSPGPGRRPTMQRHQAQAVHDGLAHPLGQAVAQKAPSPPPAPSERQRY